jgi:hypothetical protein
MEIGFIFNCGSSWSKLCSLIGKAQDVRQNSEVRVIMSLWLEFSLVKNL